MKYVESNLRRCLTKETNAACVAVKNTREAKDWRINKRAPDNWIELTEATETAVTTCHLELLV
jgi:hypothetical protein